MAICIVFLIVCNIYQVSHTSVIRNPKNYRSEGSRFDSFSNNSECFFSERKVFFSISQQKHRLNNQVVFKTSTLLNTLSKPKRHNEVKLLEQRKTCPFVSRHYAKRPRLRTEILYISDEQCSYQLIILLAPIYQNQAST